MTTSGPGAGAMAASPPLRVLGPVQVVATDGSAVPLGRQRMRNLLALLAREPGRDCSLESLAVDLAPAPSAPLALSSVRGYLSRLRTRLDGSGVAIPPSTDWGYRLEVAGSDHVELRRLALSAERRARVRDLRGAVDHAEAGLRLRRGLPFEDVDLPALELHRAQLASALLELEDLRFRALLGLGEHERIIPEIEVAVAREPLREERTAHLMVARYRAGRQRDALAAVHALRTRLAEAGLDQPVPSVRRLEAQILAHDATLDWDPTSTDRHDPDPPPTRVAVGERREHGTSASSGRTDGRRSVEAPLVGRRAELDRLASLLEAADTPGAGVVLVAGEGGIGKSRLVEEATRRMADGPTSVHWGRCVEVEGAAAHLPVVAALRSLLDSPPGWWAEVEVGPREADLSLLMPEVAEVLETPRLPPVQGDEHLRARDAMTRWVSLAAQRAPVVLCFEDIHWADRSSLLLLTHLARHLREERVVLLATYRPEEVVGRPVEDFLASLRGDVPVDEIRLRGLDDAAVAALATATAGGPCDYVDQLVERTAGNPLFIREITRHLSEARGTSELTAAVPDSVLAALDRRLGRLAPDVVDLVDAVAMTAGGAPLELLSASSSRAGDDLVDDLEGAIDAGVLAEHVDGGVVLVDVAHPLFRHVAHHRLSADRQARLHAVLASGLDPMARRDPERWLGELAHHAHRAGPDGDPWRALRACRAAGELAMERTAYHQAVTHLTHALEAHSWCWGADPAVRARLLLGCARAHHRVGAAEARVDAAAAAFAAAVSAGDSALAAQAALVHGGTRSTYGRASVETVHLLEQARDRLDGDDGAAHDALRARVLARLAQESYHVGRYDVATQLSAEARALAAATGDDGVIAACAEGEVWALYHPDRAEARLVLTTEMAERAERAEEREWEMLALVWRASACLELGRVADIDRDLARLAVLAEVVRAPSHLFRAATMTATRAIMAGRFAEGAGLAEVARRIGVDIEPENADHTFAAQMLGMLREQGALAGLMPMVEELADRYRATPGWRCALAWVFLHAGDEARAAEELAALAADEFASIPFDLAWLQAHTYLAETACALGDRERAALLYSRLAPYDGLNSNIFDIVSNGAVAHYLGILASLLDDVVRAEEHLRDAIAFNEATDQHPAAARSRFELARLILGGGATPRADDADALVAAAAASCTELGLVQLEADLAGLDHA